jgi:hypothetical protein
MMADRPSQIVGPGWVFVAEPGQLLNRRGAEMFAAALRRIAALARTDGVDYRSRGRYDDFAWTLAQADTVAAGRAPVSADGNGGQGWQLVMPSSAPVPELLTTRQAAGIIGITPRAVAARIARGELPACKVGREWLVTEYDARHAARNGRADATASRGQPAE